MTELCNLDVGKREKNLGVRALVANYVYDLVKEYNQFYHDCTILNEPDTAVRAMRLALSALTADVVRRGMWLLGIEVPERM